ncbi:hypothetical protein A6A04_13750 [Paramagnetospirillum marisnigri]|uniref:Uncharacterized protein n=1 Tax=Paramagnetospirillum marisnigri TaxID=1285242 RepID=A0A178MUY1_9PROT|nr:hypothetical protein [Paramagnetospirillum marisnigri]OAN53949.1 hypothetical protein A6A04_13750 [Paramagnetospirillum marisnigri]
MPKFLVSITREPAKPEVLEVSADNADEARWIALSSCGYWKDVGGCDATVTPLASASDDKAAGLRSAA